MRPDATTTERLRVGARVAGFGVGVIVGGHLLLALVNLAFGHDPAILLGPVTDAIPGSDSAMTPLQAFGWWVVALAVFFIAAALLGAVFRRRRPVPVMAISFVPVALYLDALVVAEFVVVPAMSAAGFDSGGTPWWGFALGLPLMWPWAALIGLAGLPALIAAAVTASLAWRRLWLPAPPRHVPDELIEDAAIAGDRPAEGGPGAAIG